MNISQRNEEMFRVIVALAMLMISVAFITLMVMILPAKVENEGDLLFVNVIFDFNGRMFPFSIQNMMWLVFFLGLGELWVRFKRATDEVSQEALGLLPGDMATMLRAKDLSPIYKGIALHKHARHFFLQRMISRVILQFQNSQSIEQANNLLNSSLELMQHEIELKYNMLRFIVWFIPTLGFIGTVIGIAFSLSDAAMMPSVTDAEAIQLWMKELTQSLGVAFNTTLVALLMSAVLVFFMHLAEGREEMALNNTGQYCLDNLINRLYEEK